MSHPGVITRHSQALGWGLKALSMTRETHLLSLLNTHQPTDAKESAFKEAMLELLEAGPQGFSRDHFVPGHFTASAFVLSPEGDSLLLIFHGKLSRWLQPGGHIEPSDPDVLLAAQREVLEETGLSQVSAVGPGLFDIDIHEIPARKSDPAHLHYDVRILLQAATREFKAGSDALDAKWVPLAEVNAVESDDSVMRAVQKILRSQ